MIHDGKNETVTGSGFWQWSKGSMNCLMRVFVHMNKVWD